MVVQAENFYQNGLGGVTYMEEQIKYLEASVKNALRSSKFEKIDPYDLWEFEKILINYVRTNQLDFNRFLSKLSFVERVSKHDARILLGILIIFDVCLPDDIELLSCVHSKYFNQVRKYTVFDCDKELLISRKEKFRNKLVYVNRKSNRLSYVPAVKLAKDCNLTIREYKAFLWLRAINQEVMNTYLTWAMVLGYCLFDKTGKAFFLYCGVDKVDLSEVAQSVFTSSPDLPSLLRVLLHLYKKGKPSLYEEVKNLSIKSVKGLRTNEEQVWRIKNKENKK